MSGGPCAGGEGGADSEKPSPDPLTLQCRRGHAPMAVGVPPPNPPAGCRDGAPPRWGFCRCPSVRAGARARTAWNGGRGGHDAAQTPPRRRRPAAPGPTRIAHTPPPGPARAACGRSPRPRSRRAPGRLPPPRGATSLPIRAFPRTATTATWPGPIPNLLPQVRPYVSPPLMPRPVPVPRRLPARAHRLAVQYLQGHGPAPSLRRAGFRVAAMRRDRPPHAPR